MKNLLKIFTTLMLLLSAPMVFAEKFCQNIDQEDVTVEGDGTFVTSYSCPAPTPYFSNLYFTAPATLHCTGYPTTFNMTLSCENRSSKQREARNISLTCCTEAQF